MKHNLFIVMILFSASACTIHNGSVGGGSGVITNDQYSGIRFGIGSASTTQFLGIGGVDKEGLVLEAKRNLILNARLKPGEVIGQTTVDLKRTIVFPIITRKLTISAEIIDFTPPEKDALAPEMNLEGFISKYRRLQHKAFAVGEKVYYRYYDKWIEAEVTEDVGRKYRIRFINKQDDLRQKVVQPHQLLPFNDPKVADSDDPENWLIPNGGKKLIRFMYKGNEYVGDLLKVEGKRYLIQVQKKSGTKLGIYIDEKDIVEQPESGNE